MKLRKAIFSVIAVFVVACVYDFLIHRIAFVELYNQTAELWQQTASYKSLPMYVSQLLFSLVFVLIFTLNYENKGYKEGLRYGVYIGALLSPLALAAYAYVAIPLVLTISWMGAIFIKCILSGLTVAIVYRN